MDSNACFATRTWGITDFLAKEFEKVDIVFKKAQADCAKVELALAKATKANETLLQSAKNS